MEPWRDKDHNRRGSSGESRVLGVLIFLSASYMPHRPVGTVPRGGGYAADHVGILGSTPLSELILKVAAEAAKWEKITRRISEVMQKGQNGVEASGFDACPPPSETGNDRIFWVGRRPRVLSIASSSSLPL